MLDPDRIADLASEFRAALDHVAPTMGITFSSFPRGSCGDTSLMLMAYLSANGARALAYHSGIRAGGSHAWCVVDGVAVDLTGDQFDEGRPAVFVGNPADPWFAQWENDRPPLRYSDEGFAGFAAPSFAMGYGRLLDAIGHARGLR